MAKRSSPDEPRLIPEPHIVEDLLGITPDVRTPEIPAGGDRRSFLMRSAVVGAAAVIAGDIMPTSSRALRSIAQAPSVLPLSADLNVVQKQKGPGMTTLDEFYKLGPGPSSSHTIRSMRIS